MDITHRLLGSARPIDYISYIYVCVDQNVIHVKYPSTQR